MGLSAFIKAKKQAVFENWAQFARDHIPPAQRLSRTELHDHISALLAFIAADMDSAQNRKAQENKSKGLGAKAGGASDSAAEAHADVRFSEDFEAVHIVAEFRALRASIIGLWESERSRTDEDYQELVRFNEAIDQILQEALGRFTERLNRDRSLFLGTLIHDLRNPLAAVSQSAELLGMIGTFDEKQKTLVDQINTSTANVSKMVSNLIDAVRVRLGKGVPVAPQAMNMQAVVKQAVDEMRAAHPECKFSVESIGDLQGKWDPARVGQLLSNLLGNAVQHGDKQAPIDVVAIGGPQEVLLSVHNDGPPIPPAAIPAIFDPLTRGEGEKQSGSASTSLGLGLFIARKIVEAHGGEINVTSSKNEGTTFLARLPRVPSGMDA